MLVEFDQMELFTRATASDIIDSKKHLSNFSKYESMVAEFDRRGMNICNDQQINLYKMLISRIENLRSSVNLIIDREIREIIEYPYIQGNKHAVTIDHFVEYLDDRTVEGIESVAETYKIMTVE